MSDDDKMEDERISKLVSFVKENSEDALAVASFLENTLGGKSGIIHGGLCFNDNFSMAHFLIMAVIHVDGDGKKLTLQIDARQDILKAWTKTAEKQKFFLLAMELYIVKERRRGISRFDEVLRKLWDRDIIGEEEIVAWHSKENALKEFSPEFKLDDAVAIRESGRRFVEWVQEGEES